MGDFGGDTGARRHRRLLAAIAGCGLVALGAAAPAQAVHHTLKVVEVYAGSGAHDDVEFIELQAATAGQNLVASDRVRVYDAAGTMVSDVEFPVNLGNTATQMSILIATNAAKTYFGITSELTMAPAIPAAGGKVCLEDPTNANLANIDCVSWGTYAGPTGTKGDANPVPGAIPAGMSLQRNIDRGTVGLLENVADDTNSSAGDFAYTATVGPRNNAAATGTKATSVDLAGTQMNVQAAAGVKNDITAGKSGTATLTDDAAPTLPNAGCVALDVDTVQCSAATTYTDVRVGDLDDDVQVVGTGLAGRLDGGDGNDRLAGGTGGDDLLAGNGNDTLLGGAGSDDLDGGPGTDLLDGGTGRDDFVGGTGTDTASYASRSGAVVASLDGVANDGSSADEAAGVRDLIGADVENLTGTPSADTLTGSTAANVLDGGRGADQLLGGGGTGVDTVTYAKRTVAVSADLSAGSGGSAEDGTGDVYTGIKNLIGSAGADTLVGNDLVNRLEGKAGADAIDARGGNDTVLINDGIVDGTVTCGSGADKFKADPADVTTSCETSL